MSIQLHQLIDVFEQYAPPSLAYDWDNNGIHFGNRTNDIRKIMITLDVCPSVVEEAIEKEVDLIVAHHPPLFKPIKHFNTSSPQIDMYRRLIQHNINVYVAHTNLDIVENGLNDWLADALELQNTQPLATTSQMELLKLVIFIPTTATETVTNALFVAGAGTFSDEYTDCSFSIRGTGQFTPQQSANPYIGKPNCPERVVEDRVEMILPTDKQEAVLEALFKHHPYEQPAFDLIELKNGGKTNGIGRIGHLKQPLVLDELLDLIKTRLHTSGMRIIRPASYVEQPLQRVAICGGSGTDFYQAALQKGADVYITGDISYHTALDLQAHDLLTIDAGHYIERICVPRLHELLNQWKKMYEWDVEIISSQTDTNPFIYYSHD